MKRMAIFGLLLSAALLVLLSWQAVSRDREFHRLIGVGDRAATTDQTSTALEAYSGAIALRSDSMLAHLKRGDLKRRRGDLRGALVDLRAAVRLDPAATLPHELLGDVNAELGRYERAQESFVAYLRLDDRSPRVLYKLGLVRLRLGHASAAVEPLRQAIAIDDRYAPAHYLLGVCLHETSRSDDAVTALERAVRHDPAMIAAREKLADLYTAARRTRDAILQLEALSALEPSRPERQTALGLAYAKGGRHDQAVITLRRVVEEHPEDDGAYLAIGRVWLETAETQHDRVALGKALQALEAVARHTSATCEALMLLARAQWLNGDASASERTLQLASAQLPVEPAALVQLALLAERAGHLGTARDALVRLVTLAGDGIPAADRASHIGELSLRLNEPIVAVDWFAKAVNASNGSPASLARLAEAQWRAGDRVGARRSVDAGLQRDARHPQLLYLQRRLRAAVASR